MIFSGEDREGTRDSIEHIGSTVSNRAKMFHITQIGRGGGLRPRSASCSQYFIYRSDNCTDSTPWLLLRHLSELIYRAVIRLRCPLNISHTLFSPFRLLQGWHFFVAEYAITTKIFLLFRLFFHSITVILTILYLSLLFMASFLLMAWCWMVTRPSHILEIIR